MKYYLENLEKLDKELPKVQDKIELFNKLSDLPQPKIGSFIFAKGIKLKVVENNILGDAVLQII